MCGPIAFTEQAAAVSGHDPGLLAQSEQEYRDVIAQGSTYSGIDYMRATHRRMKLRGRFVDLFAVSMHSLRRPWRLQLLKRERSELAKSTAKRSTGTSAGHLSVGQINLAGLPAATVPCGRDRDGLPIGLQIVAPWLAEEIILTIASAFEQARPWAGSG